MYLVLYMKKWKKIIAATVVLAAAGAALVGPIMSDVEQAKYDVVEAHGAIEIRDYAPKIVAEAQVSGERKEAIGDGFRLIADYIFGNNSAAQEVAMTAPVIQQPSQKIAMTAPVMQAGEGDAWVVQFVMPASYTLKTLPKPNNDAVKLREIPSQRFAVIRFSGMGNNKNLQENTKKLKQFIAEKNLGVIGEPTYAFFNPPWTLPLLRRNEVMLELAN
jgi:effector-binding domain-containing protein